MASQKLTQLIVFGYGVGALCIVFGAFNYYLVVETTDTFWRLVMMSGFGLTVLTLTAPFILCPLVELVRRAGNFLGIAVLKGLLVVFYCILIIPVGIYLQRQPSLPAQGWLTKTLPSDMFQPFAKGTQKGRISFFKICIFFVKTGKAIFIPLLLVLLSLGLALFFLQTSVIAPFIYTLF